MKHQIEKRIALKAPVSKVWRALTDYQQFSQWFCVNMETPFVVGQKTRGRLTYPGYENIILEVVVQKIEPERLFSFHWHPYAIDPEVDYSSETPTLVEFKLAETAEGTLLEVIESGFENLPAHRQLDAFRMNDGGWAEQLENIEHYVTAQS